MKTANPIGGKKNTNGAAGIAALRMRAFQILQVSLCMVG